MDSIETHLTAKEKNFLAGLDSPVKIQAFLSDTTYSEDHFYRCPLQVLRERKAHCFDGALFAAMALRRLGYQPLVVEIIPNDRDDDHMLALFKQYGCWGVVAQSNYAGLRYRDPVYRTIRELVMSYFEYYFNPLGEKTMRGYRGPMNLRVYDRLDWETSDAGLDELAEDMGRYRVRPVVTEEMIPGLAITDKRNLQVMLMGANIAGLFQVKEDK